MAEHIDELVEDIVPQDDGLEAEPDQAQPDQAQQQEHQNSAQERIRQLVAERNEARERQVELENRVQGLEGLKEQVEQMAAARKEEPPRETPAFIEDPQGHIDARLQEVTDKFESLKADAKASPEETAQIKSQLDQMRFAQTVDAQERSFQADHPDYMEALTHTREIRFKEMALLDIPQETIIQAITREEQTFAAAALRAGKNPAEFAYNRAQTLGWTPGTKQPSEDGELDELQQQMAAREMAGSIGGGGAPDEEGLTDPEAEAWAPIESAFEEMFGQKLQ